MSTIKKPTFRTEADLCAAFIAAVPEHWTCYAETSGWDILLVRKSDGCQVGIEAKLKLNAVVLAQATESLGRHWYQEGPDFRAVLVPSFAVGAGCTELAEHIGITVLRMRTTSARGFYPGLPDRGNDYSWHELLPMKRHQLPEFVPDVAAGASAPVQLTAWKIAALRVLAILELRGPVTRADFKALGIDARRWTDRGGYLDVTPEGYVAGKRTPSFKTQHPKVYAEIVATAEQWMPAYLPPVTGRVA